jgi:hypothetical protein
MKLPKFFTKISNFFKSQINRIVSFFKPEAKDDKKDLLDRTEIYEINSNKVQQTEEIKEADVELEEITPQSLLLK